MQYNVLCCMCDRMCAEVYVIGGTKCTKKSTGERIEFTCVMLRVCRSCVIYLFIFVTMRRVVLRMCPNPGFLLLHYVFMCIRVHVYACVRLSEHGHTRSSSETTARQPRAGSVITNLDFEPPCAPLVKPQMMRSAIL